MRNWIVYLAGMPTSLYCRKMAVNPRDPRDNDHLWITLNFGERATGTIEGSQVAKIADYYRGMIGTAGSLSTRNWGGELYWQNDKGACEQVKKGESFDKHLHFLDVVDRRCASVADVRWARAIVSISEKVIESAVKNQVVAL